MYNLFKKKPIEKEAEQVKAQALAGKQEMINDIKQINKLIEDRKISVEAVIKKINLVTKE